MKKASLALFSFFVLMSFFYLAPLSAPAAAGTNHLFAAFGSPVIRLSEETIALLSAAEKKHTDLKATATLLNGTQITGGVDENYQIRFNRFPRLWLTAVIDVKCASGGVFERCLVTRLKPHSQINAVSTAALTLAGSRPLLYAAKAKALRDSVREVAKGSLNPLHVADLKTVLATALASRAIINGLTEDIDHYLASESDLKITIPDYETGEMVKIMGTDFAPNQYGLATAQDGFLRRGFGPFMESRPKPRVIETPFHGRLRERKEHEHTDVFIDLDTGVSEIVPENTLPDGNGWDVCFKHLRHGWPYIRLNHMGGVAGANLGPQEWESVKNVSGVELHHGPDHPGILIIAHGEPAPEWNLAVDLAVKRIADLHPEADQWPIELAFLEDEMLEEDSRNEDLTLTGRSIAEALARLRDQGVRWVGVVPLMVNNCSSHIEEIRWLMGQSVEALTSEWQGVLADDQHGSIGFEGFLGHMGADLSGEFAVLDFDKDVPVMEGGFKGTVDNSGNLAMKGEFSGYSADKNQMCELILDVADSTTDFTAKMGGGYTGSWIKKQKNGSAWTVIDRGTLSGSWSVDKSDAGKPNLAGLEILLGSAIEDHPLMRKIHVARTEALIGANKDPKGMGLVLGMHGADLTCCEEAWYHMGEGIEDDILAVMPFAATATAFMEDLGDAVSDYVDVNRYGSGNAALTLHMVAPGSLTAAMPHIIGWPQLMPGVHYLYNQKTLLAYENQEDFNLPGPPFSRFPMMSGDELGKLILDSTSDLFTDWMARHAGELISAYPVDENWHGAKDPSGMLDMTDNVYIIRTDRKRYAKMRVFAAGKGMISIEYAYQTAKNGPYF